MTTTPPPDSGQGGCHVMNLQWPGELARLVGETLLRRPETTGLGQQLLNDAAGVGPDDEVTLRLDWPEPAWRAACRTLEGRVGGMYSMAAAARNKGQPTESLRAEQRQLYEAVRDLKRSRRQG